MREESMKNKNQFCIAAIAACVAMGAVSVQAQEIDVAEPYLHNDVQERQDFPERDSLGKMVTAELPNLADSPIREPSPMEVDTSKNARPSEQLLGRITSEVFHEMADLERGNVFLKLQTERETLKNDLEALKAKYRQARLDEIEKRESVIRTRVEWMQEQERIRQEILEKQKQLDLLDQQREVANLQKTERLMALSQKRPVAPVQTIVPKNVTVNVEDPSNPEPVVDVVEDTTLIPSEAEGFTSPVVPSFLSELTILDIKGVKNKLTARVYDKSGKLFTLKKGDIFGIDYVVKDITKNEIVFVYDDQEEVLRMGQPTIPVNVD